eukprot:CAMPEP_0198234338 /NCGR_PEP_ID=MMETSP1446-20131203/379_1 /TAXON_ID=1461542 ORGANISM="Unidentified sp, Strain CCMP2111" /NCGR_SAMPLE_ID=MMETSP1446 /ASSEMBLY_ACC=CAM_ASM_001112 /LENGTH=239 /DNA_ID=CAMNT_0043915105 /DNA_START=1 /DNA_END=717 /DNA_ORIENTATION=-
MYFRDFPFDSQNLVMQFRNTADGVTRFIPSATSTRFLIEGEGDIVSGWNISKVNIYPIQASLQDTMNNVIDQFGSVSNPDDPAALIGKAFDIERPLSTLLLLGFNINIEVTRFGRYYVLNMVAPLFLLVALSFITYMIPARHFDARLALNVTLFLSLTALQFIINDQLPRSSYPTTVTELILVCYAVVAFAVPETILVYAIASELTPIASREDDAVCIADSPKASFKRKLTWKGVSRMW